MNNGVVNDNGSTNGNKEKLEKNGNQNRQKKSPFSEFSASLEDMSTSLQFAKVQIGRLTNSINDLEKRIKELKESGATKEELGKLKEKLEKLNAQISITNIALDNYARKEETELLKETLQLLGASIDDELGKLEKTYATKEDLFRKEEKITEDIIHVTKQFDDRIQAVYSVAESVFVKQQETEQKLDALGTAVDNLKKELIDAVGRIGILEQATNSLKYKIEKVEREMGDKIKDMENKLNTVLGLLNDIGANINATLSNVMPLKKDDGNGSSKKDEA